MKSRAKKTLKEATKAKFSTSGNRHYANSFQEGYRYGLEDKDPTDIPVRIKQDMELRKFFEEGFQQALQDSKLPEEETPPMFCKKCVWGFIILAGSIATAASMIFSYEAEQREISKDNTPTTFSELSLLTESERQDLRLNLQEKSNRQIVDVKTLPIIQSNKFHSSLINSKTQEKLEWESIIPKKVRELTLSIENHDYSGQLTIQWIHNDILIEQQELDITTSQIVTSNLKLTSRWSGAWAVQILDTNLNRLSLQRFYYIQHD